MTGVFVDTLYWYAISNPLDQWHRPAMQARARLGSVRLVTTEEVLIEFLSALSAGGPHLRQTGVALVRTICADESVQVFPQTHSSFQQGLELYSRRPDKAFSLVDCISMNIMRETGISDVLSNDHHFTQEGYQTLIVKT